MPNLTGGAAPSPYTPNIMLDVPAGIMVQNAATPPGTEVYVTTIGTRYVIDWPTMPSGTVSMNRLQVVGKNSTTGTVVVRVRDITNNVDVATANVTGINAVLAAGSWTPFVQPTTTATYAVFVSGDAAMDPTLYSVLWEWL